MIPNNQPTYPNKLCNALLYIFLGVFFSSFFLGCSSLEAPTNRRVIADGEYKEELSITTKTPKALSKRSYHWFKSQDIYASQNDYAGLLLDGAYTKYYYTNELAEKGVFKNGLKSGKWTTWYQNGTVAEVSRWKKGIRTGAYIARDSIGNTLVFGEYKKGKKTGYWIHPIQGDTLFYYKGKSVIVDSTFQKPSFFKRTFGFLKSNTKKDTIRNRSKKKDSTKSGFFKRLFKKKDTLQNETEVVKVKRLSQKERTKLVQAKKDQKIGNSKKQKITKKEKKTVNNRTKKTKKKQKTIKTAQKTAHDNEEEPGFFKRLFRKKNTTSNTNTQDD